MNSFWIKAERFIYIEAKMLTNRISFVVQEFKVHYSIHIYIYKEKLFITWKSFAIIAISKISLSVKLSHEIAIQ